MNEVSGRTADYEPKPIRHADLNIYCAHIDGGNCSVSREMAKQNHNPKDRYCVDCFNPCGAEEHNV